MLPVGVGSPRMPGGDCSRVQSFFAVESKIDRLWKNRGGDNPEGVSDNDFALLKSLVWCLRVGRILQRQPFLAHVFPQTIAALNTFRQIKSDTVCWFKDVVDVVVKPSKIDDPPQCL